jgi:riboflavin synthase
MEFQYDENLGNIAVDKGSICINGISLTCFDTKPGFFRVTIIPYTMENTNLGILKAGDHVNLEFDILGKYVQRIMKEKEA